MVVLGDTNRAVHHSCAVICVSVLQEHTGNSAESATMQMDDRFDGGVLCHGGTARHTALTWNHPGRNAAYLFSLKSSTQAGSQALVGSPHSGTSLSNL